MSRRAHAAEKVPDPRVAVRLGHGAGEDERFFEDVPDAPPRIERVVGILEDHLHVPAKLPEPAARQVGEIDIAEVNASRRGWYQAQDAAARRGLAAAALSDQAERRAARNAQGDTVDGAHERAGPAVAELFHEVLDLDKAFLRRRLRSGHAAVSMAAKAPAGRSELSGRCSRWRPIDSFASLERTLESASNEPQTIRSMYHANRRTGCVMYIRIPDIYPVIY